MKLVILSALAIAIAALPAWGDDKTDFGVGGNDDPGTNQGGNSAYSPTYYFYDQAEDLKAVCVTYAHSHQDFSNAQVKFADLFKVDCHAIDADMNKCTADAGAKVNGAAIDDWLRGSHWGYCKFID